MATRAPVSRGPVLRRDAVGTFESRLRWSHRWKWLAPALLVGAVGLAVAVFVVREAVVDEVAQKAHAHALSLALADDAASLSQAQAELETAMHAAPRLHAVRADRALVTLLLAGALAEEGGDRGEQRARNERASALVTEASDTLEELHQANLARPEVARARAVAAALGSSRVDLRKLVTAAHGELPDDPWVAAAEMSVDLRSADHVIRDRAMNDLAMLVARRPDLLRARYLLAKGQALAGRRAEALAAIDGLLKLNPRHERALGLKESMARPPPGAPIAPPVTTAAAPGAPTPIRAEKQASLPRKPASSAGEGPAAPRGDKPPAEGSPGRLVQTVSPPAEPPAAGETEPAAAPEPPPAPRLRPAAVPEPEPVRGGG